MIRLLTALGITLGLVGAAHAQDRLVTVSLVGKSHAAVRSEVYHAAQSVCASDAPSLNPTDTACIETTYSVAMQRLRATPRAEQIAYQVPASSAR